MSGKTGWYGVPRVPNVHSPRATKVHFVLRDRPICGARLGPKMQFQFCAAGFDRCYVECKRCRVIENTTPKATR